MRFKFLELPFAALSLIWNSMMSWAGGWFFLMAAEAFTVGERDFRLPGLGSYIQEAVVQGHYDALGWGISVLILVIVLFDQLVWRPLLAWADRFKLEMLESEHPPSSWFYDALRSSRLLRRLSEHVWRPLFERVDVLLGRLAPQEPQASLESSWPGKILWGLVGIGLLVGAYRALAMLIRVPIEQWGMIGLGLGATLLRVSAALAIALAWTVPLGVLIGMNPRWAA